MNDKNQNFDELKRLLKLKRHEVPPPGFFDSFSEMVVSRIEVGEARDSRKAVNRLADEAPWVLRFLRFFEARPSVVGGFASSLCVLLIFGVVVAEHTDMAPVGAFAANNTNDMTSQPSFQTSLAANNNGSILATPASGGISISTNPMTSLQPTVSLFGQAGSSPFETASFAPASGN